MKTNNTYLSVMFAGYGHNKVTTTFRGKEVSMITTDTQLTDKYRSDNERTSNAAKRELIRRTRAAYVATV